MTLIVGIRCTDGVVIGADSAATFAASPRVATIAQDIKKISVISKRFIVAGTGSVGLGQRFEAEIRKLQNKELTKKALRGTNIVHLGQRLSTVGRNNFQSTGGLGQYGALVALWCGGKAELIEFAIGDFQPEVKSSLWYASMGSGQPVADPILGFVRRTFWRNGPPTHREGVFAATLVLKLSCPMVPIGVSEPIQMVTLDSGGEVCELEDGELAEHAQNAERAIEYFSEYRVMHQRDPDVEEPPLPEPDVSAVAD